MFSKLNTLCLVFLFLVLPAQVCVARPSDKPLPPLQVRIAPTQSGMTGDQIKPGDVIEFRVAAVSSIDAPEMSITVELASGAKLVSGDTSWSGPASKGEEISFVLMVRAPDSGQGMIKVRVTLPRSDGPRFSAGAQYQLGSESKSKPEKEHPVKKDSKGRNVIEYR